MTKSAFVSTFSVGLVALLAACGSKAASKPDAKPVTTMPDAMVATPDAMPAALMGLGQSCNPTAMPTGCPTNFPCLSFQAGVAKGYCTTICKQDGMFTTNAMGNIPVQDNSASDGTCVSAYTGGASGLAKCDVIANVTPDDRPLKPSTPYMYIGVCGIDCGTGNTCPGGLTCNTMSTPPICVP
jgi:hypothetical protein